MSDPNELLTQAQAELAAADDAASLDAFRIKYLGKKGLVQGLMSELGRLSPEEKPAFGQAVNRVKGELNAAFKERSASVGAGKKSNATQQDVSLPGSVPAQGSLHPITRMRDEMVGVMATLGFEVVSGPEIEDEFHNFVALNIPENHPARSEADNFYVSGEHLLRSQTSTVQIRMMETHKPPLRIIAPGRVYRPDTVDASHHYMFHQIEGLAVDRGLTMKDLKTTLVQFLSGLFGHDAEIRLRPNFFPFTEPSAEVDMACVFCDSKGCATCQQKGWIEMGGCGMVDPNVFRAVGYDPDVYTGFAFGLGVERLAMRRYGIPDIRFLTENDVRFLRQFA